MKMVIKSEINPITTMESESHKHDSILRKKTKIKLADYKQYIWIIS